MPIYEYSCHSCETKFELMRPFSQSTSPATCPTCKKSSERIMSTFACFTVSAGGSATPVGGHLHVPPAVDRTAVPAARVRVKRCHRSGARTGVANLPLHYGKAPRWLLTRMVKLAREITIIIVSDFGARKCYGAFQTHTGSRLSLRLVSTGIQRCHDTLCGALKEGTKRHRARPEFLCSRRERQDFSERLRKNSRTGDS